MLTLRSDQWVAKIDPVLGGEILDLYFIPDSIHVLTQAPSKAADSIAGDIDELAWISAYRGGWQLLAPNAGCSCNVDGVFHGFHGRASNDPWNVLASSNKKIEMQWYGHGLKITRNFELSGNAIRASTHYEATRDRVPFISVEHLILGQQVLVPQFQLILPGGLARELSETEQVSNEHNGAPWPDVRMLDNSLIRYGSYHLDEPGAHFIGISDLHEGWAKLRNSQLGYDIEISWDLDRLPYLWVWYENRTNEDLWQKKAQVFGIEPATTLTHLGLDYAINHQKAQWLDIEETYTTFCTLKINSATTIILPSFETSV